MNKKAFNTTVYVSVLLAAFFGFLHLLNVLMDNDLEYVAGIIIFVLGFSGLYFVFKFLDEEEF